MFWDSILKRDKKKKKGKDVFFELEFRIVSWFSSEDLWVIILEEELGV